MLWHRAYHLLYAGHISCVHREPFALIITNNKNGLVHCRSRNIERHGRCIVGNGFRQYFQKSIIQPWIIVTQLGICLFAVIKSDVVSVNCHRVYNMSVS